MVSQMWPQEEIKERLRKTRFIIPTGPKDMGAHRTTWERHQGVQEAEDSSSRCISLGFL